MSPIDKHTADLQRRLAIAIVVLREISQGKGRFSVDQLTHASNTIDDMRELARNALAEIGHGLDDASIVKAKEGDDDAG